MNKPDQEKTVLVLQGGGALGAYQAGAYEALAEADYEPDWVAGISIGAINGALIAGNRPEHRATRLREFWEKISSGLQAPVPFLDEMVRPFFNEASAGFAASFGIPGFFAPRIPPAPFQKMARRKPSVTTTPLLWRGRLPSLWISNGSTAKARASVSARWM
jgi:NTE family protein